MGITFRGGFVLAVSSFLIGELLKASPIATRQFYVCEVMDLDNLMKCLLNRALLVARPFSFSCNNING